ncbi:hypothetical protein GCM10010387_16330 [Streptomyces inusitatus]|uniref:Uncharacterized protein n=1 Tax=Streptomyces inusitatus TaxID=68221 RepID=A0A918PV07_9ACTN|nr:hypothetical protein GCM10010387_16330 [Streptomyces inusitatus]
MPGEEGLQRGVRDNPAHRDQIQRLGLPDDPAGSVRDEPSVAVAGRFKALPRPERQHIRAQHGSTAPP